MLIVISINNTFFKGICKYNSIKVFMQYIFNDIGRFETHKTQISSERVRWILSKPLDIWRTHPLSRYTHFVANISNSTRIKLYKRIIYVSTTLSQFWILSDLNYMNLDNYIDNKFFISDYEYNFFINTLKKIKASQYSFFRKYYESSTFDKQF